MEECHDVLQAGRGRQAKAGKAPLFTDRDAVQQCCELYSAATCSVVMSTAQRIITDHWKNCHAWDRLL